MKINTAFTSYIQLLVVIPVILSNALTQVHAEENVEAIFDGLRKKLALVLFKEVPGNLVVSPLLLRLLLCKMAVTAQGAARKQIVTVLGLKRNLESPLAFQTCQARVLPLLQNWQQFDSMWLNAVFVNEADALQAPFFNHSVTAYGVDVIKVGFNLPVAAAAFINTWASSLSLRRIPGLIDPDDINNNTTLLLASAAYLKTFWYSPFLTEKTTVGVFRKMGNEAFNVPMMNKLGHVAYIDNGNLKMAEIDLAIPQMSMTIIVPNDINGLPALLKNMTKDPNYVRDLRRRMERKNVLLSIPKFRIKTSVGWQGFLEKIGLIDVFNSSSNGLSALRKDHSNTKVDLVKQHIFLQVEESSMRMPGFKGEEVQPYMVNWDALTADRPFYFSFSFLIGQDHFNKEDFLVGVYYGP